VYYFFCSQKKKDRHMPYTEEQLHDLLNIDGPPSIRQLALQGMSDRNDALMDQRRDLTYQPPTVLQQANEQANKQATAQQQQEGGPQQDEQNEPPRQTQQQQAAAPKTDEQRIQEGVDKMGRTVKNKVQQIAATARPYMTQDNLCVGFLVLVAAVALGVIFYRTYKSK
jgi:hypothetical protein